MGGKLCEYKIQGIELLSEERCSGKDVSKKLNIAHPTALRYINGPKDTASQEHKNYLAKKEFKNMAEQEQYNTLQKMKTPRYIELSNIITEEIKMKTEKHGFSQSKLAKHCQLSRQTLSTIKARKFFP